MTRATADSPLIGTLNERGLHSSLKQWLAVRGDLFEQPLDGHVIDILRDGELIEVQTRGLGQMRRKLARLLPNHVVRVVMPLAAERVIVREDESGKELSRRRSPLHDELISVCRELVAAPELLAEQNFRLQVLLIHEEEVRRPSTSKRCRRRGGWEVVERRLLSIERSHIFADPVDLLALLPTGLKEPFGTKELAQALACSRRLSQQVCYCLRKLDLLSIAGKEGNALQYERTVA